MGILEYPCSGAVSTDSAQKVLYPCIIGYLYGSFDSIDGDHPNA
jgi:hypothetical protein